VARALADTDLSPKPERLLEAYFSTPQYDPKLRDEAYEEWKRVLKAYTDLKAAVVLSNQKDQPSPAPARSITGTALFKLADNVLQAPPEDNPFRSSDEVRRLAHLSPYTNRARIYRYLAQCEDASRPIVAVAYRLRAFRMRGLSGPEVATLAQELGRQGFTEEQTCLQLWSNEKTGIPSYLEERQQRLLRCTAGSCEYTVDRRNESTPKVTIIVSMYDAPRPVLQHFLAHLSAIAMVRQRQAEVVFVDSGSTTHQMDLLRCIPSLQGLSYVLVRSLHRETIQAAWNRGIQCARGEYVTCLGVDEAMTETSLDELSRFLDQHPDVDWVTANTVITQVDNYGRWKRDVMSYERSPYARFRYFNDCTYINYVGGLHRRSIYSRFGWYDGSFKGAGDTEFKCRVFPFIRTAALPKTLGFYFDFPSARVTNSANIEVEDLRAWYVFRTPGGVEYLMGSEDIGTWEELFWTALSARRCWSATPADCDLSFAESILAGILKREPAHPLRVFERSLRCLLREMRLLQDWSSRPWLGAIAESDLFERSQGFFRKCAKSRPDLSFPSDYRSDASFFAHSWMWQR
jgi:glycosyltransferase involved in cell wall biosynthesis